MVRLTGNATYADMAAGLSNPNSKGTSPDRYHQETSPVGLHPVQHHSAQSIDKQKFSELTQSEQLVYIPLKKKQKKSAQESLSDRKKSKSSTEQPIHRGRSQTKRAKSNKVADYIDTPQVQVTVDEAAVLSNEAGHFVEHSTEHLVTPNESRRPRSSSPIWIPGSITYADILRGEVNSSLSSSADVVMIHGEAIENFQEQSSTDLNKKDLDNETLTNTSLKMETSSLNSYPEKSLGKDESSFQHISQDQILEDYQITRKTYDTIMPHATPEIYEYMHPVADLEGLVNVDTVEPYVQALCVHQTNQLHAAIDPYAKHVKYTTQHHEIQRSYLPTTSTNIYQQSHIQVEHQKNFEIDAYHHHSMILDESIQKPLKHYQQQQQQEQESSLLAVEGCYSNLKPEQMYDEYIANVSLQDQMQKKAEVNIDEPSKIRGSSISYATILSQGLLTHTVPSPPCKHVVDEAQNQSCSLLEAPLSEDKFTRQQCVLQSATTEILEKTSDAHDWDTIQRKDGRKKIKTTEELKHLPLIKKEKKKKKIAQIITPKQHTDHSVNKDIVKATRDDMMAHVADESIQIQMEKHEEGEKNKSQDCFESLVKRKIKKNNKMNKFEDEIDRALKEIENMDKHRRKLNEEKEFKLKKHTQCSEAIESRKIVEQFINTTDQVKSCGIINKSKPKPLRKGQIDKHSSEKVLKVKKQISQSVEVKPPDTKDTISITSTTPKQETVIVNQLAVTYIAESKAKNKLNELENAKSSLETQVDIDKMKSLEIENLIPISEKLQPAIDKPEPVIVLKNITSLTHVDCKTENFIALRPESVEASLTNTYARIVNDSASDACQYHSSNQLIITDNDKTCKHIISHPEELCGDDTHEKLPNIELTSSEIILPNNTIPSLATVQDKKNLRLITGGDFGSQMNIVSNTAKFVENHEIDCKSIRTTRFIHDDFICPYWMEYYRYQEAEVTFYKNYKVMKIIEKPLQSSSTIRNKSSSLEKIVQDSKMKYTKLDTKINKSNTNDEDSLFNEKSETKLRNSALLLESSRYPIVEILQFETLSVQKLTIGKSVINSKSGLEKNLIFSGRIKPEEDERIFFMNKLNSSLEKSTEKDTPVCMSDKNSDTNIFDISAGPSVDSSLCNKSRKQNKKETPIKKEKSFSIKSDHTILEKENLHSWDKSFAEVVAISSPKNTPSSSPPIIDNDIVIIKPEFIVEKKQKISAQSSSKLSKNVKKFKVGKDIRIHKPEKISQSFDTLNDFHSGDPLAPGCQSHEQAIIDSTGSWAAKLDKKMIKLDNVQKTTGKDCTNVKKNLMIGESTKTCQIQEVFEVEPVKNIVQVDEQGFMEFVNRKELRSRRSRSRSRSTKRGDKIQHEIPIVSSNQYVAENLSEKLNPVINNLSMTLGKSKKIEESSQKNPDIESHKVSALSRDSNNQMNEKAEFLIKKSLESQELLKDLSNQKKKRKGMKHDTDKNTIGQNLMEAVKLSKKQVEKNLIQSEEREVVITSAQTEISNEQSKEENKKNKKERKETENKMYEIDEMKKSDDGNAEIHKEYVHEKSLTPEDMKDSGFCIIQCEESNIEDMVIIPLMKLDNNANKKLRPLPKAKANSNLALQSEHSAIEICEEPSSKVQFYIDEDDIVIVSHAEREGINDAHNQVKNAAFDTDDLVAFLKTIELDSFWLDKRTYHDAEKNLYEYMAAKQKIKVSNIYFFDPHDDNDDMQDNFGGTGPKGPSFNTRSDSSAPRTERLVADLPGGICSWNDYSTYLSLVHKDSRMDLRPVDDETLTGEVKDLQQNLKRLELSIDSLPRDSLETMLSALEAILLDLRKYNDSGTIIHEKLEKIEFDVDTKYLKTALADVCMKIGALQSQVEQSTAILQNAKFVQRQREQEIAIYKKFLEETDIWLKNLSTTINQPHSDVLYKMLENELIERTQRVTELETLPEISALVKSLKHALLQTSLRLGEKQQKMEQDKSAQVSDEISCPDATLDQAPSIHSADSEFPSWADVSLQTGQSLLTYENPNQLTKQTSTSQITAYNLHPVEMQSIPVQVSISESKLTQETIKILKTTNDTHDVIEISTKNVPSNLNQKFMMHELDAVIPSHSDDIIIDMKYKDPKLQQSAISELNIQHAAPQTFETVLVEPDDVITEVVIDADGTKRIIVKKLRRNMETYTQSPQQICSRSPVVDHALSSGQTFSEATMRGQQVMIARTKPDGTVETCTKHLYGGQVISSRVADINQDIVNETICARVPQYTHQVVRGDVTDLKLETENITKDSTIDKSEYQTKTSTVHATVQQATRRVIKETRRIIRKVTVIDGEEITSEEIIEEPEEIEINDQNIPHISINVLKQVEQLSLQRDKTGDAKSVDTPIEFVNSMQGSLFKRFDTESISEREPMKMTMTKEHSADIASTFHEVVSSIELDNREGFVKSQVNSTTPTEDESRTEVEVNALERKLIEISNQNVIHVEKSEILQQLINNTVAETNITDSAPVVEECELLPSEATVCKSSDEPDKNETFGIQVDNGTVEVVKHPDDSSTLESVGKSDIIVLEVLKEQQSSQEEPLDHQFFEKLDDNSYQHISSKYNADGVNMSKYCENSFEKVEISTTLQENNDKKRQLVSIVTQAERQMNDNVYHTFKGDIDITLPAQVETFITDSSKVEHTPHVKALNKDKIYALPEEMQIHIESSDIHDDNLNMMHQEEMQYEDRSITPKKSISNESPRNSLATTIAESTDINLTCLNSMIHLNEQSQCDAQEITDESISYPSNEVESFSITKYEPEEQIDQENILTTERKIQNDSKKKKKKKKQKTKSKMNYDIPSCSTTDELEISNKSIQLDNEYVVSEKKEIKQTIYKNVSNQENLVTIGNHARTLEGLNDIYTNIASAEKLLNINTSLQTSPEPTIEKYEKEIQTVDPEEYNQEIQTSPIPALDSGIQTITFEPHESTNCSIQTESMKREEEGIQTSVNNIESVITTKPSQDTDVQTIIDINTSESQTVKIELMQTEEVETQTIQQPVEFMDIQLQTTPSMTPSLCEEIIRHDTAIQTCSSNLYETTEVDIQTSKPSSPVAPITEHFEMQVDLIEQVVTAAMETQTTPKESPRPSITQAQVQINSSEFMVESVMQTSPTPENDVPKTTKLLDSCVQTIVEKQKIMTEKESQTIEPAITPSLDSFVQIDVQELIPSSEECIQIFPDVTEISVQTFEMDKSNESYNKSMVCASQEEAPNSIKALTNFANENMIQEIVSVSAHEREIIGHELSIHDQQIPQETSFLLQTPVSHKLEGAELVNVEQSINEPRVVALSVTEYTPDDLFDIHVQATIELSESATTSEPLFVFSESTDDSTHDTAIILEHNETIDRSINETQNSFQRLKTNKTVQSSETSSLDTPFIDEQKNVVGLINITSIDSKNVIIGKSSSDIIGKDSQGIRVISDLEHKDIITIEDLHTDLEVSNIKSSKKSESEKIKLMLEVTSEKQDEHDEYSKIQDSWSIEELAPHDITSDLIDVKQSVMNFQHGETSDVITIDLPLEPMDTSEEMLSPVESILTQNKIKPKIKSYAEVISEPDFIQQHGLLSMQNSSMKKTLNSLSSSFIYETAINFNRAHQMIYRKTQIAKIMLDRLKNFQNAKQKNHLSNMLHLATLKDGSIFDTRDDYAAYVRENLIRLKNSANDENVITFEETLILIIETISTWLETIEYKIFQDKERLSGPSYDDSRILMEITNQVNHVDKSIKDLDEIWTCAEHTYSGQEYGNINECVNTLKRQLEAVAVMVNDEKFYVTMNLTRWDELSNSINDIFRLVQDQQHYLDHVIRCESSTIWKVEELDKIENTNHHYMCEISELLIPIRGFVKDYPSKMIPEEFYAVHDMIRSIEHTINVERERLLQLLSLAEEYEQTLQEFAQITDVADNLLACPTAVISLEDLQEKMQKHRKFFINLNHCRAILESLEDNLDPETRMEHSNLHEELHSRAIALLDQAACRAQQMSLAASRWMILEQGLKEERGWLQVAHQRVPDLQTVTSSDYDQYISLYQTLSSDITTHRARLTQLLNIANGLEELVNIEDSENRYCEILDDISRLQGDVDSSLRCLMNFRESWCTREQLVNRLSHWMAAAEQELGSVHNHWEGHMRQFWELKAQYEVHNSMHNDANNCFEQALRIVPLSDEMLQRRFNGELQDRWDNVAKKINSIQKTVADTISSENTPVDEKLRLLESELNELRWTIDGFHGVLKTEEELDLYVKRLSVLFERVCMIQDELGKLGMLPATESEKVGLLLSLARRIESQIGEELDAAQLLQERLQALQRGLDRVKNANLRQSHILDQCETCEKQGSDVVAGGVERCQKVADELVIIWKDLMGLRQILHTLPGGMRVSVSPVGIERYISSLQDMHSDLESRCARLLLLLKSRFGLWRRFERQLELVQQSVQEADYMMELLTIQGSVDYERLLKATERLESLNGDLGAREVLIGELREAAVPLRESCAPEVSDQVDAALNEAIQAWEDTRSELGALCTKYQHAVKLWEQYKDSSAIVKAWVDTQMEDVTNLSPEQAREQVKMCEETLAEHNVRLAQLRDLVAQIASDVGLDTGGGPLQCEVEALGRRLEDVCETLSTLADTADAQVVNHKLVRDDLCQTKFLLDSFQQDLSTAEGEEKSKEKLNFLRNHLLVLTRTEPQLELIKDRTLEVVSENTSVIEVLQLWQRVFRETFQQYHRLSARLVQSEDVTAALDLWEEYLSHVQEFLSNNVPGDYKRLSEDKNLCQVHKNLLTDQQQLTLSIRDEKGPDLSLTEQFNVLTNLHNETLSKIMERHTLVEDRLAAWDKYKINQTKVLTWLKDIERERSKLQLRFIHLKRLDKILMKIDILLDQVPSGEMQIKALSAQQDLILTDCEETLAVSIRIEHAAHIQRITNLRAGLETWRDFVLKIQKLNAHHIDQTTGIIAIFRQINQSLNSGFHDISIPSSNNNILHMRQKFDSLHHLRTKLTQTASDLKILEVTTEQLGEFLSPSDMKGLNQHVSLLWHQHGDLEHQLALLAYKLEERLSLSGKWENRRTRFLVWLTDTETRLSNYDATILQEPEEALKRLESELDAEMALKQRELEWLQNTGEELICVGVDEDKEKLEQALNEINGKWNRLMNTSKIKTNKLTDLMSTMSLLEKRIAEIRGWLGRVEMQLTEPFIIESKTQNIIDEQLKNHEILQKTIESESGNIGEVLNLCEILLSDCDTWKVSFNTDVIKSGMQGLEKRWKATCLRSAERKRKIITAWRLIQQLDQVDCEQKLWIDEVEMELSLIEGTLNGENSMENTEKTLLKVKRIVKDIDAHNPALIIFEQNYSRLAKCGLEPENMKHLTANAVLILNKWHALKSRTTSIINSLKNERKAYREFIKAHESAVVGLTQIDIRLTQIQHLTISNENTAQKSRHKQIADIDKDFQIQSNTLQRADELALMLMQDCHENDVVAIQTLVDEYQLLWKDIKERVATMKTKIEESDKVEIDEAIQVETLKFEQDTAVQVNTLPKMIRMTSRDAYLMQLESALSECRSSLHELEDAIALAPTAGPGLTASAKNIAKLLGSCQSAVELAKHLYELLVNDGNLSNETAKISEVNELIERYDNLLIHARLREQQIRDISNDGGKLKCPLCCHRNWAQLDIDLWRLEKWLEYAEGIQSEQHSPPSNIEELEVVIQNHRELLLDLDSHKSIVISLNVIGAHLEDHTEDIKKADELRDRLSIITKRWDKVCQEAGIWQTALQSALMSNNQFHRIVDELLNWLKETEITIRDSEPIDLTENTNIIRFKYNKFCDLRSDLERCEPRVLSLQEAANQLLDKHAETRYRLQELRFRLQSLRRLT
ncbi:hypothetical protein PV326_003124, partial [Microctonus aethiopoides]